MEWQPGAMSSDIEDRRGDDNGGGGGGFGFGGGGIGIVGFIILVVLSLVTGHNFLGGMMSGGSSSQMQTQPEGGAGDSMYGPRGSQSSGTAPDESGNQRDDAHLISFTLNNVQAFWTAEFPKEGWGAYRHAKLVLYTGETYSGCGDAQAATGPFYCPADNKVYIDLSFWNELKRFGGSTADFAQSYVLAHELGHHVQYLLGIEQKVERLDQQNPDDRNHISVDVELQADCFGGVWAHSAQQQGILDPGDVDAALSAVAAVGDDHLEKMAGRAVTPDSFTHGSSAQREQWFKTGFTTGDPKACTTFNGELQP